MAAAAAGLAVPALCRPARAAGKRQIVDAAGRKVAVPARVTRVFAAGPPAAIMLFTIAPELMLGWTSAFRDDEKPFVPEPYANLPGLGRLTGRGNTANLETVLRLKPDLILDYGTVNSTYASLAERVQKQTGIPYILLDGRFDRLATSYHLLGAALDRPEVAGSHVAYIGSNLRALDRGIARVPKSERPRVYFARGPAGLQTGLAGSINTEIVERAGAVNVAASLGRGGLVNVSMEQVLGWNPDTIVTVDATFHKRALADPVWGKVKAVREKQVYLSPRLPFGWIDFPPAVNRLLGLQWLVNLFYPKVFRDDLRPVIKDFHRRFYHRIPTDAQIAALLAGAMPQR
ncbi:MAG: iron ABC transporter substrate-binding protein [Rhodospirillaceae bacterium]|nr:iron ABC transporter substrate-binding protein [Rhodospirillaceae bacterium]